MICFCFNLNSILKFISLLIGSEGGISSLLTMNTSYWGREKAHALTICWILLPVSFFFSVILSLAINESPLSFASRIHYWVHLKDVMRSYMYKWCQRRWAALRFLPGKLKRTKYRWSAYYINKSVGCRLSCLSALGWEYTKGRSKLLCLLTQGGWKKNYYSPHRLQLQQTRENSTKVEVNESLSPFGLHTRIRMRGNLQELWWLKGTCITEQSTVSRVTTHRLYLWNSCVTRRQLVWT